jgi:hypothetical protein
MINNNQGNLQLPNQNDSFRRAHSDSSLNQSVSSKLFHKRPIVRLFRWMSPVKR